MTPSPPFGPQSFALPLTELSPLGGEVWRVRLSLPSGVTPPYAAGQYLLLERTQGEPSAFSLASAPHQGQILELHILGREPSARVQLPFGDVYLTAPPKMPVLLLASGAGMAQMQSLLEH